MTAGSDSQLSIVRDEDPASALPPRAPDDAPKPARVWPPRNRMLVAGAAVAIALLAWAAFSQYQRAESLAQTVVSLEAELVETSAELSAYRVNLAEIRVAVGDLGGLLDRLRGLVDRDPAAGPLANVPEGDAITRVPPAQDSGSSD